MNRSFLLPLSALAFGSVACSGGIDDDTSTDSDADTQADTEADTEAPDALIGNWDATSIEFGEYVFEMPLVYTYEDGADSRTETTTLGLEVTPALASLVNTKVVTDNDGAVIEADGYSSGYSGTWATTGERTYLLSILDGEDSPVELTCTIDVEDDLLCTTSVEGSDIAYSFERGAE